MLNNTNKQIFEMNSLRCNTNSIRKVVLLSMLGVLFTGQNYANANMLNTPFEPARDSVEHNGKNECSKKLPKAVVRLNAKSIYDQTDASRSTLVQSQVDAYKDAVQGVRDFNLFVAKYASNYTDSDGRKLDQAACVLRALELWAQKDALSELLTRQAYLTSTRVIAGAALTYMQVRQAAQYLDIDVNPIDAWLEKRATEFIPIYTQSGNRGSNRQNHRYWGGLAIGAVGVAVGNRELLEFGVGSYKIGIDQVDKNGALPLELARDKKARDYHLHAIAPLIMIASLASVNGYEDIFDYRDGALHQLVTFTLDSINSPSKVEKLTGYKQVALPMKNGKVRGDKIAWLEAYLHHTPEANPSYQNLFNRSLFSSSLGGRTSIMYHPEKRKASAKTTN